MARVLSWRANARNSLTNIVKHAAGCGQSTDVKLVRRIDAQPEPRDLVIPKKGFFLPLGTNQLADRRLGYGPAGAGVIRKPGADCRRIG
jgi:hypothetical protein